MSFIQGVDHTKIISFNRWRPKNLLDKQYVALPYYLYSIAVETQGQFAIADVFERVIFKLTHSTSGQSDHIAEMTGLHLEFVQMIQSRLAQLGLITEGLSPELTKEGQTQLQNLKDQKPQKKIVWCLRSALTGEIIPYLGQNEPSSFSAILSRHVVTYTDTRSGRSHKATRIGKDGIKKSLYPTSIDINRANHKFSQLYKSYMARDRLDPSISEPIKLVSRQCEVQSEELIFMLSELHAFESSHEFLLTDGIGMGYSDAHLAYIKEYEPEVLDNFSKKLGFDDRTNTHSLRSDHHPLLTNSYPLLVEKLTTIAELLKNLKTQKVLSTIDHEERLKAMGDSIKKMYESFEQAFYYLNEECPNTHAAECILRDPPSEDIHYIKRFSHKLGLEWSKDCKSILNAKRGQLKNFSQTKNMQPGLALAIISANYEHGHPFSEVAVQFPKLLLWISHLKKLRDQYLHGDGIARHCTPERLDQLFTHQLNIMSILFPTLTLPESVEIEQSAYKRQIKTHQARQTLDHRLSHSVRQRLGSQTYRELLNAIILEKKNDPSEVNNYILMIANAFQNVFKLRLDELIQYRELDEHTRSKGHAIKELAFKKMKTWGFISESEPIPKSLSTANEHRVERAWHGDPSTLGPIVIAYFTSAPDDILTSLSQRMPKVLTLVAEVLNLRGHGNTELEWHEVRLIKQPQEIYDLIQTIMEL